jgi:hypothetical protein
LAPKASLAMSCFPRVAEQSLISACCRDSVESDLSWSSQSCIDTPARITEKAAQHLGSPLHECNTVLAQNQTGYGRITSTLLRAYDFRCVVQSGPACSGCPGKMAEYGENKQTARGTHSGGPSGVAMVSRHQHCVRFTMSQLRSFLAQKRLKAAKDMPW